MEESRPTQRTDVIVVGAGAAGLIAAWQAATAGNLQITLIEKARKAGVKILMSGGSRCNITHDCDVPGIMKAFGKNGRWLRQALQQFPPAEVIAMFHRLGVQTKVESTGKIFPVTDRALDVRNALLDQARSAGVEVRLGTAVLDIQTPAMLGRDYFRLQTENGVWEARKVILTVGGQSYPGCGTVGEGYRWLQAMGHTIVPTRPALVPLVGGNERMHELSGLTLPDVELSVMAVDAESTQRLRAKKPLATRRGGFLFTHFGFSGPAPMDVSGVMTNEPSMRHCKLRMCLLPGLHPNTISEWMNQQRQRAGSEMVRSRLLPFFEHHGFLDNAPKRLVDALLHESAIDRDAIFANLSRSGEQALSSRLVQWELPVSNTRGFKLAEVTAGGVALKEVDPRTMQSHLVPSLYIAGEILDLDGWIGGYNFQSAWSTGYVAGRAVAATLPASTG